jgi:hypothetical protein
MTYTEEDIEGMHKCYLGGVDVAKQTVTEWDLRYPEQLTDALDFLRGEIGYLLRAGTNNNNK